MPSQQSHIPLPAEDVHGFSLDDLALYTALTEFNYCHSEPAHPVVHDQVLADINPADLIPNINPFDTSFNDDPELINGYVCASPALSEASFDFSAYLVDDSKSNQSQPVVQNAPVVAAVTDPVATATGPVATTVLAPTQVVGKVPNPVVTVATGPVATVQAATQVAGAVPTSVVTVAPVTAATGSVTAAQPPVQAPASVASFIPMSVTPAQVPQAADQAFVPWTPVSMAAPAVPKYASAVQANAPVASTLGSHFASTGFSQVTGLTHLVTMMPLNMLELASHHVELVNNPVREIVNVKHEDIVAFTQSGHTDCLQFSSLAEALADHAHNCEPPLDHTIPRTVAAKKVYVMLLCQALQTIQFAIDGPKTMKTFLNANFSSKLVELRAWEMVVSCDVPCPSTGRLILMSLRKICVSVTWMVVLLPLERVAVPMRPISIASVW